MILQNPELKQLWVEELAEMRDRINTMRKLLSDSLAQQGAAADFSFIPQQRGMFSFLGVTPEQVKRLREEHSVYMMDSSRISIAGINHNNIEHLCHAISAVL